MAFFLFGSRRMRARRRDCHAEGLTVCVGDCRFPFDPGAIGAMGFMGGGKSAFTGRSALWDSRLRGDVQRALIERVGPGIAEEGTGQLRGKLTPLNRKSIPFQAYYLGVGHPFAFSHAACCGHTKPYTS